MYENIREPPPPPGGGGGLRCEAISTLGTSWHVPAVNCLKPPLKMKTKTDFQDRLSLNAGQKYCIMLQESILQYFRPSLSYHLSSRPL